MKTIYTITALCSCLCLTYIYAESNAPKIGWVDLSKVEDQSLLHRDVVSLKEALNNDKNNDVDPFVRFETVLNIGTRLLFGAWFDSDLKPIATVEERVPFGPNVYNMALGFVSVLDNDINISFTHAKDIVKDLAEVSFIVDSKLGKYSDSLIDLTDEIIKILDSEYTTYGISKQGLIKMAYPMIVASAEQQKMRRSEKTSMRSDSKVESKSIQK